MSTKTSSRAQKLRVAISIQDNLYRAGTIAKNLGRQITIYDKEKGKLYTKLSEKIFDLHKITEVVTNVVFFSEAVAEKNK